MATITIKNVGPVKEAHFELNKINVFMGPQSSGKSTIAKIISYCQWVEKRRFLWKLKGIVHFNLTRLGFCAKPKTVPCLWLCHSSDRCTIMQAVRIEM